MFLPALSPRPRTGHVFLQSDVLHAAEMMRDEFEQHAGDVLHLAELHSAPGATFSWNAVQEAAALAASGAVVNARDAAAIAAAAAAGAVGGMNQDGSTASAFVSRWADGGWLCENPLGVPTEREHYVGVSGGRVFRVLLQKGGL